MIQHPEITWIERTGYPSYNQPTSHYCEECGKCLDDEDEYEDMMDELDDLDKDDYEKVKIEFSVKGGKLVGLMLKSGGEKINVTFSDIGKTDIDYDELDDMLDAAEEW